MKEQKMTESKCCGQCGPREGANERKLLTAASLAAMEKQLAESSWATPAQTLDALFETLAEIAPGYVQPVPFGWLKPDGSFQRNPACVVERPVTAGGDIALYVGAPARIAGFDVVIDANVPTGEAQFRTSDGDVVGRITNIATAPAQAETVAHGPLVRLTAAEESWMLRNPYALRLLMDYQDQRYSEYEAMRDREDSAPWPPARWKALQERGRSIMAEDLDCWPDDLLRAFGFPERVAPAQAETVAPEEPKRGGWHWAPPEATPEMLDAAAKACNGRLFPSDGRHGPRAMDAAKYRAMAAVARRLSSQNETDAERVARWERLSAEARIAARDQSNRDANDFIRGVQWMMRRIGE